MSESAPFGNTEWYIYAIASYVIVAAVLIGYALNALAVRKKALQALKNEGFLSERTE